MPKAQRTHCPLCYTQLEETNVAPCAECGHLHEEIEHAVTGKHTFAEIRIFGELSLILCSFCQVDFGSFRPEYFGLPHGTKLGFGEMQFVREASEVFIGRDKFCPQCDLRLAFLKFVVAARELHSRAE